MISFLLSAIKIIFLLGFLIFIHESGHFIVAKLCKVRVNEFAIGFGPTIWKKQGKETKYALRLIPLGGFISMEGEEQASEEEGSFSKASIPRRIAIVAAGAIVNILFGIIIYFILMTSSGTYVTNRVSKTIEGYPASEIGLQENDEIIEMNGKKVSNKHDLDKIIRKNNGEIINIKVQRNSQVLYFQITPKEYNGSYYIGVEMIKAEDTFINRLSYASMETGDFMFSIVDNLKMLFTGKVGVDQMMGPVGISEVVSKTSGWYEFIYILALVSLSLGVTNLLPIPALDGGKILILIIEAIRRKPLNQEIELKIQLLGFSILIALSLFVTYNDIVRLF